MMISRKEFERLYSADLLPSSMENYSIGDIWDWKGLVNQRLVFCDENVSDVFINPDLKQKLKAITKVQGNLPSVDMTADAKVDISATIPVLKDIQIGNTLNTNSIMNFSFQNVMGRNISDYRMDFNQALEKLKSGNFDAYKDKIRDRNVVMQYWYAGTVSITVDLNVSNTDNLKMKIQDVGLEFTTAVSTDKKETISIKPIDCPFAAQLIKGRDL